MSSSPPPARVHHFLYVEVNDLVVQSHSPVRDPSPTATGGLANWCPAERKSVGGKRWEDEGWEKSEWNRLDHKSAVCSNPGLPTETMDPQDILWLLALRTSVDPPKPLLAKVATHACPETELMTIQTPIISDLHPKPCPDPADISEPEPGCRFII